MANVIKYFDIDKLKFIFFKNYIMIQNCDLVYTKNIDKMTYRKRILRQNGLN